MPRAAARCAGGAAKRPAGDHRLGREYGLEVDPDARVGDLPVGAQQRVEILKALFRGAQILILDEPTGVLTPQEADRPVPHPGRPEGPGPQRSS